MKHKVQNLLLFFALSQAQTWADGTPPSQPKCIKPERPALPSLNDKDLNDSIKLANWVKTASGQYNQYLVTTKEGKSISCANLAAELSNTTLELGSEINSTKNKKLTALNTFADTCSQELAYLLAQEKASLGPDDCKIEVVNSDIDKLNSAQVQLKAEQGLLSQSVDPDQPVKNFSKEQLQSLLNGDKFADIATEKPYYGVLEIGASLMPKYNKEGNNEGFQDANYYAALKLNNRWALKDTKTPYLNWFKPSWVAYQEMNVLFYSAPIACEKNSEPATNDSPDDPALKSIEESQGSCNKATDIGALKFKDVSHTVNASANFSFLYANKDNIGDWEIGFNARVGLLNREKLSPDLDSVSTYSSGGVEFRLNDFLGKNIAGKTYRNGLPRFVFNYSIMENRDFAGTNTTASRKVSQLSYRIYEDQPVYFGLVADVGQGPDTMAITLTYGIKPNNLFGLFSAN
ncbi:MAG TPA: hypothetical protein PKC70_02165 [Cellvibrionaceae bacterium]|nr:hypothetical protein [Cellvibrionaceae bacterium]